MNAPPRSCPFHSLFSLCKRMYFVSCPTLVIVLSKQTQQAQDTSGCTDIRDFGLVRCYHRWSLIILTASIYFMFCHVSWYCSFRTTLFCLISPSKNNNQAKQCIIKRIDICLWDKNCLFLEINHI